MVFEQVKLDISASAQPAVKGAHAPRRESSENHHHSGEAVAYSANQDREVKTARLSGSVPFKRLELKSLPWQPNAQQQKQTSRGKPMRLSFDSVVTKQLAALVLLGACVSACVSAGVRVSVHA